MGMTCMKRSFWRLSLAWATAAFGAPPEAVNFWMGEDAARTTAHADLYENIYIVIRGEKRFTLLPPQDVHVLGMASFPAATWRRTCNVGPARGVPPCGPKAARLRCLRYAFERAAGWLAQAMSPIDPDAICAALRFSRKALATASSENTRSRDI